MASHGSSFQKTFMGGAGSAGAAALDIPQVFNTFPYTGNSSSRSIVNGIDLSSEGGLVWTKLRRSQGNTRHVWIDTARGVEKYLQSNVADAEDTQSSNSLTAFNDNGYTVGNWGSMNANSYHYVSWSFRKAPKFFDVVTYSGTSNGSTNYQDVAHNLGVVPGMVMVKRRNSSENWAVWHRSIDSSADMLQLNINDSKTGSSGRFSQNGSSNMTATTFRVYGDNQTAANGGTYVAYLFAHNNNDGEFGPSSDQDIIKCDSYTGNGNATGPVVDLGFEPQFLITKNASSGGHPNDWLIVDNMRGVTTGNGSSGGNDEYLQANERDDTNSADIFDFNATGFSLKNSSNQNANNDVYIYMAIRRGPLAVPTDATKVFHLNTRTIDNSTITTAFPVDMSLQSATTFNGQDRFLEDRVRGFQATKDSSSNNALLRTNTTAAEDDGTGPTVFNVYHNSYEEGDQNSTLAAVTWMWGRAPNYFDIVAYPGNGSAKTVAHNLGVAPEMMWIKRRDQAEDWQVYCSALGNNKIQRLNSTVAAFQDSHFNNTTPTSTVFSVGSSNETNGSGGAYVAYLFATAAGVSKCGSYTGNGVNGRVIDCGFSSGARFVLIKGTSSAGYNWCVWDSVRGIVSGNDPKLTLDSSSNQQTGYDFIDPADSGFSVTNQADVNNNGVTFIFYAIA